MIELVWRRSDPRADDFANLAAHLRNFVIPPSSIATASH
jgi:LysR family hydrogen peroxide-inducible transcriptional activator